MTDHIEECIEIFATPTPDGTVMVATNCSPYICFEAATQEEALKLVSSAIAFYNKAPLEQPPVAAARAVTTVRPRWSRTHDCVAVA